jgi:hypothetical protein
MAFEFLRWYKDATKGLKSGEEGRNWGNGYHLREFCWDLHMHLPTRTMWKLI